MNGFVDLVHSMLELKIHRLVLLFFFFLKDTPPPEISTLPLPDALPICHVHVLLEVVPQREVEERPTAGGQLHRRGETALHDREITSRKVPVEVVHVGNHLEPVGRSEEHTSELQSQSNLVCRLLLEKKKT